MSGRIEFSMGFGESNGASNIQVKSSYRVYILGNFSGCNDRFSGQHPIYQIDRDSFDQVMSKIKPTLYLDKGLQLEFESLDDFHPDVWLHKVKMIADLQLLKMQLNNPVTAAKAAEKIQSFLPFALAPEAEVREPLAIEETQEDMLQRLLGKQPEQMRDESDSVARLIKDVVSPHVHRDVEPQYQNLIQVIDTALNQLARVILHDERFQRLEAVWRATAELLQDESAERQQFFLVNANREEMLAAQENANSSFLTHLLQHVQRASEQQQVMLVGDFCFSAGSKDESLLIFCDYLANSCHTLFIAAAENSFVQQLLNGGDANIAKQVRLVYPNYLLRLPYGKKLDPIETFEFEECLAEPKLHELLWGCSSLLLARALIRISQGVPESEATFFGDIPVFSFDMEGEQVLQAGAKWMLTEAQINELLVHGIVPLVAYRQKRGVRLVGDTSSIVAR